jgi:amino-acid N-acetyltransferase
VTATRDGVLVGCAALEVYGRTGLLRSVAVEPSLQRSGVGRALVSDRLAAARAMKLDAVYLLTTTAADYFPRLGFIPGDRQNAPAELASSPEFASVCPSSAKCLVLRL